KPNISDFYHSRGVVYLEIGDYDMAIDSCTRALELYDGSGSPGTYVVRGKAYKAKGMDREALNDFNRALEIQPNFEEAISAAASMGATNEGYSMLINMQTEIKKMDGVKDVQVLFGEHGRLGDPNKKKTMTVHVVVNKTPAPKMELKIVKVVLDRYPLSEKYDIIGIHLLEVEDVGIVPNGKYYKHNAPPKAWKDEIEKLDSDKSP
ncbi:MAG TPA: tetratricopeptide repeat protein, partial [Ruminiclostridium sp.]|nr:tetratricopeptide repeat protein [Ruminiclostridium sp.]